MIRKGLFCFILLLSFYGRRHLCSSWVPVQTKAQFLSSNTADLESKFHTTTKKQKQTLLSIQSDEDTGSDDGTFSLTTAGSSFTPTNLIMKKWFHTVLIDQNNLFISTVGLNQSLCWTTDCLTKPLERETPGRRALHFSDKLRGKWTLLSSRI